jgi:predicted AlkP superfamily phosphohydrolase/phosphomutase
MLSAWQSTPRPLKRLLRPVRDHVVRRLYLGPRLLDGHRKCLNIPNNDACGGIRLNVVGREPTGRVQPGAEYDRLCQDLERCLMALTNTATGEPVVRRVLRTADLYQGPRLDYLPDLIVEWTRDAPVASLSSPTLGRIDGLSLTPRTGDHKRDGLWMATGSSVRAGYYADPVSVMDFGPTIAATLGVDLEGVDGKPIAAMLSSA